MGQAVPAGHVRLINADAKLDRTFLLGEEPPKVTGGVGGWEIVARPRQVSMTLWQGVEPYQVELSIMLDGLIGQLSQEPAIRELLAAGRGDDEAEPSTWEIRGVPAVSAAADEWVLNSAEPGDTVLRRTNDFSRVRQSYALTFVEHVPAEYVQLRAKARQGARGKSALYTVRKGDTPASIARKRRRKWTEIRDLNRSLHLKANTNLKDGTRIRVPVATATKKRKKAGKR